jgi:hypothetical protein
MEIQLKFDDFTRKAYDLGMAQDQVSFALSRALNNAAVNARRVLTEVTWPTSVDVHNPSFMRAALSTIFSTKSDLRVVIYDRLGRADLAGHAWGGTKLPRGRQLAIPLKGKFQRGSHGIPKGQRPRALIASTPKRALRITAKGIFIGAGGRLNLQYSFKSSATQPADVPFEASFQDAMLNDVRTTFPSAMASAMLSRR